MTEPGSPITLGLDCSNGGAATLAVDGMLVAAATERCAVHCDERGTRDDRPAARNDGSIGAWLRSSLHLQAGQIPEHAVAACLQRGQVTMSAVKRLVLVDDLGAPLNGHRRAAESSGALDIVRVDRRQAAAWQMAAVSDARVPTLIVCSDGDHFSLFRWCDDTMTPLGALDIGELFTAIEMMSRGCGGDGRFDSLDQLAARPDASGQAVFADMLTIEAQKVRADHHRLSTLLDGFEPVASRAFGIRPAQQLLIAAFCERSTAVLTEFARNLLDRFDAARIAFIGDAFSSEGIRTGLTEQLGAAAAFAPFGDRLGPAAGAALVDTHGARTPLRSVSLGPALTESDVKAALDNCRLDYVYEPDWQRLLIRTSQMLSRGNVVSWFNGSAPFGASPDPARAILCDPSKPYARDNVNRFLRLGNLHDPLTVFLPADGADAVVTAPMLSAFLPHRATPRNEYRDRLRAALDQRGQLSVQTVTKHSPALHRLLTLHRDQTGVPGLIASALGGEDGVACSPRDAIRATFSSAVDALVIERFLIMKDWWLLRSAL